MSNVPKHNLNGYNDCIKQIIDVKPDSKVIIIFFKDNFPDSEMEKFRTIIGSTIKSDTSPKFIFVKGATKIIELD